MSYAQIAERLDLTESAVRGLVARGLARLAAMLG
ncbi:MAG: sigma-70 family RNA polymerase sigma factor [Planctomycetes bacterium]|nr:sigma-70 family RNA polymerase sigma factor [Planctomycetota bacterium]